MEDASKRSVEIVVSFDDLLDRIKKVSNTDFILIEFGGKSGQGMSYSALHLKWALETHVDKYKVKR